MSFNAIRENKILAKISEFTVINDNPIGINNFKHTNFDGDIHAHSVSNLLLFLIYVCTALNILNSKRNAYFAYLV